MDVVDLERFLVDGRFGPISLGASLADLTKAFGEADYVEPERGATPMLVLYGEIEFQLFADRLTTISFELDENYPLDPGSIRVTGLSSDRRSMDIVRGLLEAADVTWRHAPELSVLHVGVDSQVWVTANQVRLTFFDGVLVRVVLTGQGTS